MGDDCEGRVIAGDKVTSLCVTMSLYATNSACCLIGVEEWSECVCVGEVKGIQGLT